MTLNPETTLRSRGLKLLAYAALAVMAGIGLAGCGGSGPGGGDEVMIVPDPSREFPDLMVESPAASPDAGLSTGSGFTLSVTVRNAGDGAAAATTVRFYRSADAAIAASDEEVGSEAVGKLSALGSSAASVELTSPSTSGTYYYGACVDAVAEESDTGNNCSASVRVTVVEPPPDLVVESPTASDASPTAKSGFTLSVTVRNAGSGAAAATTVRFYRSDDAAITATDEEVGSAAAGELAASGSGAASVELTAPSTPGTYYHGACVDAVAAESDTGNNCSASVRVTVPAPALEPRSPLPVLRPPRPDLVVEFHTAVGTTPLAGKEFRLSAKVRNVGIGAVPATKVRFYRSADATITKSDKELIAIQVASWGKSAIASTTATAPTTLGTYYYGICVDAVAGESDTSNNCTASVEVTVQKAPPPDIWFASSTLRVVPAKPVVGGVFKLRVQMNNAGGQTGWIVMRYFRSDDATFTATDPQVGALWMSRMPTKSTRETGHTLNSPDDPGTYYYRVCADEVTGESDTSNNCSSALKVEVTRAEPNLKVRQ